MEDEITSDNNGAPNLISFQILSTNQCILFYTAATCWISSIEQHLLAMAMGYHGLLASNIWLKHVCFINLTIVEHLLIWWAFTSLMVCFRTIVLFCFVYLCPYNLFCIETKRWLAGASHWFGITQPFPV